MLIANIAGGKIAIKFNAQGSCLPITTACATSNNEIGEAYRAINTAISTRSSRAAPRRRSRRSAWRASKHDGPDSLP